MDRIPMIVGIALEVVRNTIHLTQDDERSMESLITSAANALPASLLSERTDAHDVAYTLAALVVPSFELAKSIHAKTEYRTNGCWSDGMCNVLMGLGQVAKFGRCL